MIFTLIKKTDQHGQMKVGDVYEYTYKHKSLIEVKERARRALLRDYPDARMIDWEPAPAPEMRVEI